MHPSETKILVCCHKPADIPDNGIFLPVHCGQALSDKDLGMTGDDTGDNISAKNPNYCELDSSVSNSWTTCMAFLEKKSL